MKSDAKVASKAYVIVGLIAAAASALFVGIHPLQSADDTEKLATIESESYENGSLWQVLERSPRRTTKRRLGLADELWIDSPPGKFFSYRLVISENTVMTQTDTSGNGQVGVVTLHLADGRRCKITNLSGNGETAKVTFEK